MRNKPSDSSGRPGRDSSFRKDEGRKPFNKDSKPYKKNYDGRESGEGKPSRPGKPYSGRLADNDKPKRSFGGDDADSRPRRSPGGDKPFSDRPKRSFDKSGFEKDEKRGGEREGKSRKPFDRKDNDRPFSDRPKRSFDKTNDRPSGDRPKRSFDKPDFGAGDRKPRYKSGDSKLRPPREERSVGDNSYADKPKHASGKEGFGNKRTGKFDTDKKPRKDGGKESKPTGDTRPFRERLNKAFDRDKIVKPEVAINEDQVYKELEDVETVFKDKPPVPFKKKHTKTASGKKKHYHNHDDDDDDDIYEDDKEINQTNGPRLEMPLNKYIAHSGECSRRDAAELVKQGKVKVNGELITDPGHRVKHDDKVTMSGKKLTPQKGMVYILLNKPKGFITTNDDPQGRRTVMDLVGNSGVERLFPVGRLDRDTSGLLLITNDGDLTQKLCHPTYNIKKVYHVTLDKALTKADFDKVIEGVELEDGKAPVDALAFLEKKNEVGLEIHSGKNRIVRRIFESLGYVVEKLDRVMYAGLTKKNLPRSKWRFLDEREVILLKHFKG